MASFNKLTIGNQTFDVSGVIQKLDAQWIKSGDKWYVSIPPKSITDYQVGQVYQINFNEMYKILAEAGVEEYPKYSHYGIETYVVSDVDDGDGDNGGIGLQRLHAGDNIDDSANIWFERVNAEYFRCPEEYFLPYASNTYNGSSAMTNVEIDQVPYYSIPTDIIYLYSLNPDGIIFHLGSAIVKCFRDGKGLHFINLATYNQIPYERDDNEDRYLIKVSDVQASYSSSSSGGGTQLLHAAIPQVNE